MNQIGGYHIKTTLGEGGMARVYLATQASLERSVVIKVLNRELIDDPVIRRQFAEESKLIARLNHPNIVQVIDQGTSAEGAWFVMPYVKSVSLDQILTREDVPLTRKIDIAAQIAKALAYAHNNGLVHRDIKPSNVLVDYEGHVRLLDFGIAGYFAAPAAGEENLVMGTADYMAPEQLSGKASPRSDIYALGVLMHELFTGVKPTEKHLMVQSAGADKNPLLPGLLTLVEQYLKPNPEERPTSAEEVRRQLLLAVQGRHLQHNRWGAESFADNIPASYTLLDVLKENPFGATYLVNDPKHHRLLVLKKQRLSEQGNALTTTASATAICGPAICCLRPTITSSSRTLVSRPTAMAVTSTGITRARKKSHPPPISTPPVPFCFNCLPGKFPAGAGWGCAIAGYYGTCQRNCEKLF